MFDKLKITDMRNACDIQDGYTAEKYCIVQEEGCCKDFFVEETCLKKKKTDLRDLKEDKEFPDVTLACEDGRQVGAHKVVLIAPSTFFEKS